ncbi:ATP-binding protein, partial [Flagellimonas olearia]
SASQRLQQHTEQLWAVLGQLQNNPDIALQTLDALWLNLPALPLPSSGVRSDEWRTLLKARLDIQSNGRTLRSEQWKTRPLLTQIDNLGGLRQAPQLLQHESQR